ncbi:hypothetical protein, partial [Rhodococcus jostii]
MTTPDGSSPPDALGTGDFAAWQAMTEADAKAQMRGPISGFSTAQTNFHGKFDGYATGTDLADLQDRTQMLEGVIGYAHAYCTGGAPVGNADTFIPLN